MTKLVDIDYAGRESLNDIIGGLTSPSLIRNSATTDSDGNLLQGSWSQLIDTDAQNDITDAWWGKGNAANSTSQAIVADTVDTVHRLYKDIGANMVDGNTYLLVVEAKKGLVDGIALVTYDGDYKYSFFDLTNGVTGTTSSNHTSNIEDKGSGWYRCNIVFTSTSTDNETIYIYTADGEDVSFIGDNINASTYIRNIMLVELPSNMTIGDDLFDQESLGSDIPRTWEIASGSPTIDGDEITFANEVASVKDNPYEWELEYTYKVSVTISDYTGSGNIILPYDGNTDTDIYGNSIRKSADGTYEYYYSPQTITRIFIYSYAGHTATVTVNSVKEITSPHKGTYGWPYSAGSEVNTEEDATAPPGTTEANDVSLWNNSGFDTFESEADPYLGTYSAHFIAGDDGDSAVTDAMTITDDTLYRYSFYYKIDAATDGVTYSVGETGDTDKYVSATALSATSWTEVKGYFFSDGTNVLIEIIENGANNNAEVNIDNLSIRPIQTSWVPYGTNTIEIDEDGDNEEIKITYVDDDRGAYLYLRDAEDLYDDLVENNYYKLNFSIKVGSGDNLDVTVFNGTTNAYDVTHTNTTYEDLEIIMQIGGVAPNIKFDGMSAGEEVYIKDLIIKEIPDLSILTDPPDYENVTQLTAQPVYDDGLILNDYGINLLPYSAFSQWTNGNTADYAMLNAPNSGTTDTETLAADAPATWAIHTGTPSINGQTITFANESASVRELGYTSSGTILKISATISNYSGSNLIYLPYIVGSTNDIYGNAVSQSANGTYVYYIKSTGTDLRIYSEAGHTATVTVNSVQEITSSDATQLIATAANGTIKYTLPSTVSGAEETFSIWMKRITGTGNIDMTVDDGSTWTTKTLTYNWTRFNISGTETAPVVGIRIVTSGDAIGIFGAQLEPTNFWSQYLPTDGCPIFRSTEVGEDTVSGLSYTMGAKVLSALNTTGEVTLIADLEMLNDYDAVDTGSRGLVAVDEVANGASIMTFNATEGVFTSWATDGGACSTSVTLQYSEDDLMTVVARLTADRNDIRISGEINDTWDLDADVSCSSVFAVGTSLWLMYNENGEVTPPIKFKRLVMYDEYLTDNAIQAEPWNNEETFPIMGIIH